MIYSSDDGHTWFGGTVYDPKNGKTSSGKMALVSPNQPSLRGFVGIPLCGRSHDVGEVTAKSVVRR